MRVSSYTPRCRAHGVLRPRTGWSSNPRKTGRRTEPIAYGWHASCSHLGVKLVDTETEFTTPPFSASVTAAEFYQHPVKPEERRVVASLRFSHPVSRVDLMERLHLSILTGQGEAGAKRPLTYQVRYGLHDRTAHVHSEIISIGEQENFVTVANGSRSQAGERG